MDSFVRAHNHKKHRKPSDPFLNNRKDVKYQLKRMLQGLQTSDNEVKNAISKPCEVFSSSDSYSDFDDFELDVSNHGLDVSDSVPVCDASNNTDVSEMKEGILENSMSEESNDNNIVNDAESDQQAVNMYSESTSDCASITCDDESDDPDSLEEFDHEKNLAIKIIEKLTSEGILSSSIKKSKSKKKKKKKSQGNNNHNMLEVQGTECAEIDKVKTESGIKMENVPESPHELEQIESEPENGPELELQNAALIIENAPEFEVNENAPEFEVIENAPELVAVQNMPQAQLNFDMADPKVHTNGRGSRKLPHDYVSILVNNHPYLPLDDIIGNYKHSTFRNVPSYPGRNYFRKFH